MIRHLRLLAYLRWKYLLRAGGRSRRIGAGVSLVVSLAIAAGLYFYSSATLGLLFEKQPPGMSWELVHLAFAVIYFFWLYSGSFNDLYDPARLASFPVVPRTLFLGSTLASFIGMASIFGGALLAGFAVGVPGDPFERVVRALLFVLLIAHLQMTARLIRLTFLAVLTSRRWRDAAVLISTLIGGGMYVATQLFRTESGVEAVAAVKRFAESGGPSAWLAWCPGVWLSWAYQLDGARSAAGFGAFALVTALIHRAGGWAEERLAFSEPIFQHRPKRDAGSARVPFLKGISRAVLRGVGPAAAAVTRKELAIFFRDPVVRHRVLSSVFYILVPFVMLFVVRSGGAKSEALAVGGFILLFVEMFFLTNIFGFEGAAVRNLLWFPASRRHLFLGKNLAYFALFAPFNAVVLVVLAAATGVPERIPAGLASHFSALLVVFALGNVTSVYFPMPFLAPGQRVSRRDESGCLMMLARSLLYLLTFALLSPVLAVSLLVQGKPVAILVAFAGLAYAGALYAIGLKISERALLRREEALGDYFRAA